MLRPSLYVTHLRNYNSPRAQDDAWLIERNCSQGLSSFQVRAAHHCDPQAQRRQDCFSGGILRMSNSESPASLVDEYFLREAARILSFVGPRRSSELFRLFISSRGLTTA